MERRERHPDMELEPHLLEGYAATFISRFDRYHFQRPSQRSYSSVKRSFDLKLIQAHLQGKFTIATYALSPDNQAKWVCFDADTDEQWHGLWCMAHYLNQQGVTSYVEPSRRGGHLWLFFSPRLGADARQFGRGLVATYELGGIELFPKKDVIPPGGVGSSVRLPLGCHQATGIRYHFLSLDNEPLAPTVREQIKLLANPHHIPEEFFAQVMASAPAPPPTPSVTPRFDATRPYDSEAPLSERLKQRISVFDFVSQYVTLDSRGVGFCPFHEDIHQSFGVNIEGNYWNCFSGCGGGSIIDFWMRWREKDGKDPGFAETIKEMAEMLLPHGEK